VLCGVSSVRKQPWHPLHPRNRRTGFSPAHRVKSDARSAPSIPPTVRLVTGDHPLHPRNRRTGFTPARAHHTHYPAGPGFTGQVSSRRYIGNGWGSIPTQVPRCRPTPTPGPTPTTRLGPVSPDRFRAERERRSAGGRYVTLGSVPALPLPVPQLVSVPGLRWRRCR